LYVKLNFYLLLDLRTHTQQETEPDCFLREEVLELLQILLMICSHAKKVATYF